MPDCGVLSSKGVCDHAPLDMTFLVHYSWSVMISYHGSWATTATQFMGVESLLVCTKIGPDSQAGMHIFAWIHPLLV